MCVGRTEGVVEQGLVVGAHIDLHWEDLPHKETHVVFLFFLFLFLVFFFLQFSYIHFPIFLFDINIWESDWLAPSQVCSKILHSMTHSK